MTDLCDRCRNPGRCCTGFGLPNLAQNKSELEILVDLATLHHGEVPEGPGSVVLSRGPGRYQARGDEIRADVGLPFMPLCRVPGAGWRFWCFWLAADGRCGNYAERPALCRAFEAGSEPLCVMHVPDPPPAPASPAPVTCAVAGGRA